MELRINGRVYRKYNNFNVHLKYDAVESTFSFALYFDPTNSADKAALRPGAMQTVTVTHHNVVVITGTILRVTMKSAGDPPKSLMIVEGGSITGILSRCTLLSTGKILVTAKPSSTTYVPVQSQFINLTLPQIAKLICDSFGLVVKVDTELQNDKAFNTPYDSVAFGTDHLNLNDDELRKETCADFLDKLCKNKQVILSHTAKGEVYLTRHKSGDLLTTTESYVMPTSFAGLNDRKDYSQLKVATTTTATARKILWDFSGTGKHVNGKDVVMELVADMQDMHSLIHVVGQNDGGNAKDSVCTNPYIDGVVKNGFNPNLRAVEIVQSSGTDVDSSDTARSIVGDELKDIVLTVDMQGWELGGHLVTSNQLVTVADEELYLYNMTKFFIQEVTLKGDEVSDTATLTCVLPECFNDDDIDNIFG